MTEEKLPQEMSIEDLNRLYTEGEECDKRVFAEMRTNLQLVAGEHYVREGSKFWNRIRDDKQLTSEQRIKLTKNHIQRVTKIYRNEIESVAPGVAITAANENELQDQKAAQLNQAYWNYVKECENISSKTALWVKNYVELGEVCVKVFWDTNSGNIIGYEPVIEIHIDPMTGQQVEVPAVDPMTGEQVPDQSKPVYGGKPKYETFDGYNVRRDQDSRSMDESPFILLSKLLPKRKVRTHIKDADALRKFDNQPSTEYTVYDNNTGHYKNTSNQILIKECYWRPCPALPRGYYVIYTDTMKISEGELPHGIWPIIMAGFDEQSGNARSHSIIRHLRPSQVEINRCASKIAEHQVTLADDKVWVASGTKLSQGSLLPGIRSCTYTGMKPEITEGRSGDQYLNYLVTQVDELYKLAHLPEIVEDQPETQDMMANLLKSYRFKKKFAIYGQKFERFYVELVKTTLQIAKKSISDYDLIQAIGRNEQINIPEFKNTSELQYSIKVTPRTDDVESQFGKQITLNHVMQYVGPNLDKEDIGQMLRLSPFLNEDQMWKRFTQKYDRVVNDILAMDRGQFREPRKYDDHKYIINALTTRMSEPDFENLDPRIQQMYEQKLQMHEQAETEALAAMQRAQSGFIPSGGYLVGCEFWVPDPKNPESSKRLRIPSEALAWLVQKLQDQGTQMQNLLNMPVGVGQDMGAMLNALGGVSQSMPGISGGMNAAAG